MIRRIFGLLVSASLLVAVLGQNGAIPDEMMQEMMMKKMLNDPKMKDALRYQSNMQEMAKKMASDPRMQKAMEEQMKKFSTMSQEEMQAQLKGAMETLANSGDLVDQMIASKDTMLSNMKKSGMVPKELIKKYEQDPDFFEKEIRATFSKGNPMSDMFSSPEDMANMMKNMFKTPN